LKFIHSIYADTDLLSGKFLGIALDNETFGAKSNTSVLSISFHKSLREVSVMETAQVSKEPQVKEGSQVKAGGVAMQPQEVRTAAPNPMVGNLETSFKEALDEIRHCDEQANLWLERKTQLQSKVNETLASIQKQVGGNGEEKPKKEKAVATRTRVSKDATVPELIRSYLEKNGAKRTRDIRKFLLDHGRKTSPGVALSRMLKNGDLKQSGRGIYKIA
jgi:hypothetical protein